MFFRDENIKARFRLEQSGFERQLGSIVRMQMELRDGWCLEIESIRGSEAETAQARGKQPRGGSLAAANEKVAPGQAWPDRFLP